MSSIYDQHDRAFRNVAAFVIVKDGERVATIAFKFGNAVTAYVHWIGVEMVKATANGGGYDRKSAACGSAAKRIPDDIRGTERRPGDREAFIDALHDTDGRRWDDRLRDVGFSVFQAV